MLSVSTANALFQSFVYSPHRGNYRNRNWETKAPTLSYSCGSYNDFNSGTAPVRTHRPLLEIPCAVPVFFVIRELQLFPSCLSLLSSLRFQNSLQGASDSSPIAVKQGCGRARKALGFVEMISRSFQEVGRSPKMHHLHAAVVHHSTNKPDADQWPSQLTFGKLTLFISLILRK